MKKLIMLGVVGLMSFGMFAGNTKIEFKKVSTIKMIQYNYYCDGELAGTIWAEGPSQAMQIAIKKCNP